jgi:uncharacterized protein (UPF0335 family)
VFQFFRKGVEELRGGRCKMSDRSKLMAKVLQTWESSEEGREYLEWLLKPKTEVDGGDLLREAVLDVLEDDDQLNELRHKNLEAATNEFLAGARLPDETVQVVKESTAAIATNFAKIAASTRRRAVALRELRHALNRDRIETLEIVAQELRGRVMTDEIVAFLRKFRIAEELAAKITALSRTSAGRVNAEEEWHKSVVDSFPFDHWLQSLQKAGEGWFDYISEGLDRYYAHQVVVRLEQIVERASSLEAVKIEIANNSIKSLFQEAHEAFLYGFDTASIALCRSLVEHALKDKLPKSPNENQSLGSLIERASRDKLLQGAESESARKVLRAGNDVMHNVSNVRKTAQEVLDCTRIVLNKLYAKAAEGA